MDRWRKGLDDWKFGVRCLFLLVFITVMTAAGLAIVIGAVSFLPGLLIEAFLGEQQTALFEARYFDPLLMWGGIAIFVALYPTFFAKWIDQGIFRRPEETTNEQKLTRRI